MKQMSNNENADSEFSFSPTNKVVGFIDDADNVKAALYDLKAAGFTASEVEILVGEEGAHAIRLTRDATAGEHHASIRVVPSMQRPPSYYDSPGVVKRIERQLADNHFSIAVAAEETARRARAGEILKSHRGHFINFYGRWMVEAL